MQLSMLEVVEDVGIAPSTTMAYLFNVSGSGVGIVVDTYHRTMRELDAALALNVGVWRRVSISVCMNGRDIRWKRMGVMFIEHVFNIHG